MFKTLLRFVSKGKLSIFIYHQVLPDFDPLRPNETTAKLFEQHISNVKKHFTVLSLADAMILMEKRELPANAAVITFDDGYENNASVALPLLKKYQLPATFFIASDFLNGGMMWNDTITEWLRQYPKKSLSVDWLSLTNIPTQSWQEKLDCLKQLQLKLKYLPIDERLVAVEKLTQGYKPKSDVMMTDQQVKLMADAGMEIGGHTCSHPILAVLDDDEALMQLTENKKYLENIVGKEITSFAYPNGIPGKDFTKVTTQLVQQAGYKVAVTTGWGVSNIKTNPYQIPRFTPWRDDKFGFLMLLFRNYFTKPKII